MADSQTCGHEKTSTHTHENSDGSTKQVTSCDSCGMEW